LYPPPARVDRTSAGLAAAESLLSSEVDSWAWWSSVIGAVLNLSAAGWLLFGFKADNPRYNHPPTFDEDPGNVRRLIHDQAKVGGLVVAGSALQLLGVVLERIS
jgi:hypothetical protein